MSHGTLHNHPTGDPKPSREDIEMTREVKAAEALGIAIHDYLVIGRKGHASFRNLGCLIRRQETAAIDLTPLYPCEAVVYASR